MRHAHLRRTVLIGATLAAAILSGSPPAAAASNTGSITGHVTTAVGVAAADVEIVLFSNEGGVRQGIGRTTTNGSGDYRLTGLGTGSYLLSFTPLGGATQYYHQKADLWQAEDISVVDGTATRADEQLLANGVLAGQIRDSGGAPVPGLEISARNNDTMADSSVMTDGDGRYRIPVLPGRYVLSFTPIADFDQKQYIPGTLDGNRAKQFEIRADQEVVADDTVIPTGSMSGRLTTAYGAPLDGARVSISPGMDGFSVNADANGEFVFPTLLAGSYQLSFEHDGRSQYYRGKTDPDHADPVVVTGSQDTRITDSLLPTGAVRVSAIDATTGAPIFKFCLREAGCSNGSGEVMVDDLPTDEYRFTAYTEDSNYTPAKTGWVTVEARQAVDVTVELHPAAKISTVVVDRITGKPVPGVCVAALQATDPESPPGLGDCSDDLGRMTIQPVKPGAYNLFAFPRAPYGRQWVGASGGTGDQRAAVTVMAKAGTIVAGPQILLDRSGTITGRVTDGTTGSPLFYASVNVLPHGPTSGPEARTDANGHYEITRLGPYDWPLLFQADTHAGQWSGGVGNRYQAATVKVTAGASANLDAVLGTGVEVRGSFRNQRGEPMARGHLMVHNSVTGDIVGETWMENGQYSVRVLPGQSIYFSYIVDDDRNRSYEGDYLPLSPPRRDDRGLPVDRSRAVVPAGVTASRAGAPIATATTGTVGATGSVPRRPAPPPPGIYPVPASGTLTVDIVITTD